MPWSYGFRSMAFKYLVLAGFALLLGLGAAVAEPVRIVGLGDSLMAGYNLDPGQGFTDRLQAALRARGHDVTVDNAGVSGDTSSGGLSRLDWSVPDGTQAVILELGANDALRGIDPKEPGANLDKMLSALKSLDVPVLLAGMKAPNNWGEDYVKSFDAIYTDLAAKYGVPLYPFFLDGVALDPTFSQPDGLHPTASGIGEVVKRILPDVEALVQRISQRKTAAK